MTIDDGHIDLTGGQHAIDAVTADWVFFFGYDESAGSTKDEQYRVNFVGPGSITVDRSGLWAPFQLNNNGSIEWFNLQPITIKSSGIWAFYRPMVKVVKNGADFNQFFRVDGEAGQNDYRLTSLLGNFSCDFDEDGQCGIADIDQLMIDAETGGTSTDMNADGTVDMADRDQWLADAATGERRLGTIPRWRHGSQHQSRLPRSKCHRYELARRKRISLVPWKCFDGRCRWG